MLFSFKLVLTLKYITVDLLVVFNNPVPALIIIVLLLEIVMETFLQIAESSGKSRFFRLDLIQTELQGSNQSSFLLIRQCQFPLLEKFLKVVEVSAKVNVIFMRIIDRKQICCDLVDFFNGFNQSKHIILRDLILVVNRKISQLRGYIRARHICQLLIIFNI